MKERIVNLDELEEFLSKNRIYINGIDNIDDDLCEWFKWLIGNMTRTIKREEIEEALQKALGYYFR